MKRTAALLCAAFLVFLCFACEKTSRDPVPGQEKSIQLLTLYTDTQPMRIVTREKGVKVTLQRIEHEPTVGFIRPIADEWEETLAPGREYELPIVPTAGLPEYRLFIRQGDVIANYLLTSGGGERFEIEGGPWAPAPIDETSPMIHLCRTAAIVPQDDGDQDLHGYWYAIANAIATLRAVDLDLYPDEAVLDDYWDEYHNWFRVTEWLFEAYALALYPGMDVPPLGDYDLWVQYHPETHERYWVGEEAYSDSARAKYKSAAQNPDGTWDVTIAVSYEYSDVIEDRVVTLAPNAAYNPDSPFEYHIVGWPAFTYDGYDGSDFDGPPLPEEFLGTWTGPVRRGQAAWLELFADGTAGLYLGDDGSDQLYEIYIGWMTELPTEDDNGITAELNVRLDWHIYESGDGMPADIPDAYSGLYILRQEGEALYITVGLDADALFGRDELELFWIPKTCGGGHMVEIESVG